MKHLLFQFRDHLARLDEADTIPTNEQADTRAEMAVVGILSFGTILALIMGAYIFY